MENDIDLDLIRRRLDTLRPVTRAVFLLHRTDELDYDEIAWRFGMDVRCVERHVARACRRHNRGCWAQSPSVPAGGALSGMDTETNSA